MAFRYKLTHYPAAAAEFQRAQSSGLLLSSFSRAHSRIVSIRWASLICGHSHASASQSAVLVTFTTL